MLDNIKKSSFIKATAFQNIYLLVVSVELAERPNNAVIVFEPLAASLFVSSLFFCIRSFPGMIINRQLNKSRQE